MIYRIINKLGRISPNFIGRLIVNIPFKNRYGKAYIEFERKIKESQNWNEEELEKYIVSNFNKIFKYAKKFELYRDKYEKAGVLNLKIKNIIDIEKIPILTKSEIRDNILDFSGDYYQKTGGTTGYPTFFYLDKNAWAREWAHYHALWKKIGYKQTDAKFVLRRQNTKDKFISYNFEHNDYWINTRYLSNKNISHFFKVLIQRNVKYFHGYPSAIQDFLKEIDKLASKEQKVLLKKQIKYAFFSSEYPSPNIVKYLRDKWELDLISMYGHSEMCVLASSDKNGIDYFPFHTYGYTEVENNMLIGTSYHNFDMPLIRYNTDDLVRAKRFNNGILKSFEMKEGRVLDYIEDRNGLRIAIVGMFLDKYHDVFNYIDYIQLFQDKAGFATIILSHSDEEDIEGPSLMDLNDIAIDFDFLYLKEPIRSPAGKVPFRVWKLP